MNIHLRILGKLGLASLLIVSVGLTGCSPEGTNSAPKLKGSKDEIQKALQSGGAKPTGGAKSTQRRGKD
jgi:hypothetical protein